MGVLLITCPDTEKEFSTGLQLPAEDVYMLPDVVSKARCPHCRKTHKWRPREARYADAIPPQDWIENQHTNPAIMFAEFDRALRNAPDLGGVLDCALSTALSYTLRDKGNIQLVDWDRGCLRITAQRGFDPEFLKTFECVPKDGVSACGRAFRLREPVIIEDVAADPDYAPFVDAALNAGYRSVVSVPLISARSTLVGVMSVHSPMSQIPPQSEIMALTKFAELTANAVASYRDRQPSAN
jgi:GAF domain